MKEEPKNSAKYKSYEIDADRITLPRDTSHAAITSRKRAIAKRRQHPAPRVGEKHGGWGEQIRIILAQG